jgi:hypothetical protein
MQLRRFRNLLDISLISVQRIVALRPMVAASDILPD